VYKNQIINVYERRYESCGGLWPFVTMRIISALLVAQITLLGVLSLKLATSVAPFALPLPVLTLVYSYWLRDRFEANFQKYPLEVHTNPGGQQSTGGPPRWHLRFLFLFILVVIKAASLIEGFARLIIWHSNGTRHALLGTKLREPVEKSRASVTA
jgi:hypothetical protein